jgi:hypothetical protein
MCRFKKDEHGYRAVTTLLRCGHLRLPECFDLDSIDTEQRELADAVLKTWYQNVNCLCCKHNKSMRLHFSRMIKEIALYVECEYELGVTDDYALRNMEVMPFSIYSGKVACIPIMHCYPKPIEPAGGDV